MRESSSSSPLNILRPTIADVVTDLQLLKAAEILREKSCASAHSLASVLSVIRYVLGKPYFPESVFGNKKSVAFDFRGQSCVVEFASCENSKRSFQNVPNTSLEAGRNSTSPSVLLQPTIADVLSDPQTLRLIDLLQEKSKESPSKLASLLCIVKAVLDDVGLKGLLFSNKITFTHLISSSSSSTREYTVEFEDQLRNSNAFPTSQFNNEFLPNGSNNIMNNVSEIHVFKPPLTSEPHNHHNHHHPHHPHQQQQQQQQQQQHQHQHQHQHQQQHEEDEDMMDELEKDEIVEEAQPETDIWRHPPTVTKRKRNSDSPSDEDHCAPPSTTKRRSTDKHKAPPLSCEAVKRLFTGITKAMLLQRLEESKALISSIKESYSGIRPPNTSSNLSSSPRLNLLCHLLQSPPTSRIDGISSKVFSNLELYKLFTTYNSYKEEVAQTIHPDQVNSPNKRNHSSSPSSTDPSPITFPTYSSFIDPTVTLHIKEQTGGKEVGKHRLNCAWRLSILCELLGKGVLLMTKELSGAKLERILVEEFSKLVDFLKNPENQDWVASVREKMELVGFDEVYEPLDEADIGDSNNNSNNNGGINHVVATSGGPIGNDMIKQGVGSHGGGHNDNGHVGVQQVIFLDPNMSHPISSQQDKRIAVSPTDDAMNNVSYGQRYPEGVSVGGDPTLKDDAIAVRSSPSRSIYNKR